MFRKVDIFLFALLIPGSAEAATLERVQILMGTTARIRVWGESASACDRAIDAAFEEMAEIDRLMSTYRPESEISRLNRAGASGWVEIDPRFHEVLREARAWGDVSNGAFDHTVLPLMRLWGFRGGTPEEPSPGALRAHLKQVGYRHVRLHPDGHRVRFDRSGVEIDLGGIAKGYALDRVVARLKAEGTVGGVVDLGGNLSMGRLRCLNHLSSCCVKASRPPWSSASCWWCSSGRAAGISSGLYSGGWGWR